MIIRSAAGVLYAFGDAGRSESRRPRSAQDCTVRAVAAVCDVPFDTAYDELARRGRKPHHGATKGWLAITDDLLGHRFTWSPFPAVKGQPRMAMPRFVAEHPEGAFIVRQAGHVLAVLDGIPYDEFTSDARCIYGAWSVVPHLADGHAEECDLDVDCTCKAGA